MAIVTPQQIYQYVHSPEFSVVALGKLMVSPHFSWGEVFTNRKMSEIRSASISIFHNAVQQAARMEKVRAYLGKKLGREVFIDVSSWYRSPGANQAVGGATGSSHLVALATDFTVRGYADEKGNKFIQALLIPAKDSIGFCLEITNGKWTHVDGRPAHIVFENLGGNRYRTLNVVQMQDFIRKYGVAA